MKRRDLLLTGGAFIFAQGKLFGQPANGLKRGAVVIGVDKIEGMTTLHASEDAKKIKKWLAHEKFIVKDFIDEGDTKVNRSTIFNAVDDLITHNSLEMLVIYFAGHGYLCGPARECWLLSGAPRDPGDAVSV